MPYPIGVGILLFGGRGNEITGNRVFGNYLMGVGALQQLLLKQADAKDLVGNKVMNNSFGLNGTDLNGRDLFYDGNGRDNCFSDNTGMQTVIPSAAGSLAPCPFSGANTGGDAEALGVMVKAAVGKNPDYRGTWVQHPHGSGSVEPLVEYKRGVNYGPKRL